MNPLPTAVNPGNGATGIAGILPQPHLPGGPSVNTMHVSMPPTAGANASHPSSSSSTEAGCSSSQQQQGAAQQPHHLIVQQIRTHPQLTQLMLRCYQA